MANNVAEVLPTEAVRETMLNLAALKVFTLIVRKVMDYPDFEPWDIMTLPNYRRRKRRVERRASIRKPEELNAVDRAMRDVTHVVHLATCKEIPETVMDVTVKGLFWLLEAFRDARLLPVRKAYVKAHSKSAPADDTNPNPEEPR